MKASVLLFSLAMTATFAASATEPVRCSTPDPSQATVVRMLEQAKTSSHAVAPPGVIKIVWHDIRRSDGTGALSDDTLLHQMAVLNAAMRANGIPITFDVYRGHSIANDAWFTSCRDNQEMVKQLSYQPENYINVFSCDDASSLGWAYQPYAEGYTELSADNRVYVNYKTLPGGAYPNYDLGATLVHEIGHYLGLVHVFYPNPEDGTGHICEQGGNPWTGGGNPSFWGDFVADTPAQKQITEGCPAQASSSCPGAVDSIHNFMDYSYDSCLTAFTPGQKDLLYYVSSAYRPILWSGGRDSGPQSKAPVLVKIK